ncbi:LOG family protein isoform A [Balamuthia mandrillaris]
MKSVCVFCGSKEGKNPDFMSGARAMGEELAARGLSLVYGGGTVGLMGAVSRAVVAGGGEVTGIIPRALAPREISGEMTGNTIFVSSMHERKAMMAEKSDCFVALPGGFGTFEELFEIITWLQLGIHNKPIGLLNIEGYYEPLLALVQRGYEQGFIGEEYKDMLVVADNAKDLLDGLERHQPPPPMKNFDWKKKAEEEAEEEAKEEQPVHLSMKET